MNSENDHDYFRCTVVQEKPKAYCVMVHSNGVDYWVPKSLCELNMEPGYHNRGVLEVEAWFAQKEGMHDD